MYIYLLRYLLACSVSTLSLLVRYEWLTFTTSLILEQKAGPHMDYGKAKGGCARR